LRAVSETPAVRTNVLSQSIRTGCILIQLSAALGPLSQAVSLEARMGLAIAVIGLFVVAALVLVGGYNGLVGKRNRYKTAYAQIDVQLKRRYDLIPNLVETVKGYMKHESETLEAVIRARNAAYGAAQVAAAQPGDPNALKSLATAETALAQGLSKILALSEAY